MAIDLNKGGEENTKPKFNLSKSTEASSGGENLKGADEPKKKLDLSKSSSASTKTDQSKAFEAPKKNFDLSKQSQATSQAKEPAMVSEPAKSNKSKLLLFAIIGIVGIAAIIWFISNKSMSPDKSNTVNEQVTTIDKTTPAGNNASNTEGTVNAVPNGAADSSKSVASKPSETKATASQEQEGKNGGTKQASEAQPSKLQNSGKKSAANTPSATPSTPYKKNESYDVYQFPFGDSKYSQPNPELDKLAEVLKQNPAMKISITAYTDNIGNAEFNMTLSKLRAKSIGDYLAGKGIDANRMKFQGKGISTKFSTNAENRRAEFVISE